MFTDPSLILARVRHRHEPARRAAFVVVPEDHGIRFALEGPDPAQDYLWDRRHLSREQALDANKLLCSSDPSGTADLAALAREAESYRFVWSVGRQGCNHRKLSQHYPVLLPRGRRSTNNAMTATPVRLLPRQGRARPPLAGAAVGAGGAVGAGASFGVAGTDSSVTGDVSPDAAAGISRGGASMLSRQALSSFQVSTPNACSSASS